MSRVKSGKVTHARHRKVIKQASGYYAARSTNFRTATQAVDKANQYATRDRKTRKRNSTTARHCTKRGGCRKHSFDMKTRLPGSPRSRKPSFISGLP